MNSTKDYILSSIKENKPKEEHAYPRIPTFDKSSKPLLEEFKENLLLAAATYHDVKDSDEAQKLLKEIYPDAKVVCSTTPEIKGNKDISQISDPHDLEDVDVGIIRAEFGVSENGMVWMTEKDLIIDALGFLSQHLIILLDPTKIVRDMYEAYNYVNLDKNNYGCFMLGPSATADIGAVMVRGAQGARTLTVFFI